MNLYKNERISKCKNQKGGFVLVSIVLLAVILEGFAAVSLVQQLQDYRMFQFNQMKTSSFYAGQGIMERALAHLADRIANFSVNEIVPNTNYTLNYSDGRTSGTYMVRCVQPSGTCASPYQCPDWQNTPLDQCPAYTITEGGLAKTVQDYEVIVNSASPDNSAMAQVFPVAANSKIHQIASMKQTSIFQYAIFYNSDLEMLPGPNMTISGNIHANGDGYLGSDGNTLTINSESAHFTGDVHRERKDDGQIPTGQAVIKKAGTSTYPALSFDSSSATWTPDATSTWNGSIQSGSHGVQYIQPVTIPSIQPNGFYYNTAGLRVVDGQAYQRQANGTYTNITGSLPAGTIVQDQFRNNRENSSYDVVVTEIDVNKLRTSGYFPSNGLIYATRTNAVPAQGQTSATSHGIRLINGSEVRPTGSNGGLTVVTNNPLYVRGDFNTVNKKSVALISDAFNILSNSWDDANSNLPLNSRVASNTTINAGMISGIVPTTGSQYSGGLENYPRFLEKWSSKNMNIAGSFINLWDSQIGTGQWIYGGNYYAAPIRNWSYDSSLQSTPPPFTPVAVEISTKTWWQESKESVYL